MLSNINATIAKRQGMGKQLEEEEKLGKQGDKLKKGQFWLLRLCRRRTQPVAKLKKE